MTQKLWLKSTSVWFPVPSAILQAVPQNVIPSPQYGRHTERESYNDLAPPMARKAEAQQGQEQLQSTQTSVRWHHSHIRHGLHGKIKPRAKPQNTHQHSSPPRTANAPDMHYTDPAGSLSECSQWTRACARRRRVALHYCTDTTRTSLGGTQHLPPGGPAVKRSWCSTTDTRPASLGGRGGRG